MLKGPQWWLSAFPPSCPACPVNTTDNCLNTDFTADQMPSPNSTVASEPEPLVCCNTALFRWNKTHFLGLLLVKHLVLGILVWGVSTIPT